MKRVALTVVPRPALVVSVLLLCACGGGPGGSGPGGSGGGPSGGPGIGVPDVPDGVEPIESFNADKIAAACRWAVRCHDRASVDGCISASFPVISTQVVDDVHSGVILYDPHLAYRCIQIFEKASCDGPPDLASCHNAFTGTLPAGAACNLHAECVSDACTMMAGCANSCCPPGTCATGVNARNIPVDAACRVTGCVEGAYCSGGGVCVWRVGEGGKCPDNVCQAGLVCHGGASTLDPNRMCVRTAAAGESCATRPCGGERPGLCRDGVCVPPGAAGEACALGAGCELDLDCIGGVCTVPGALGEACGGNGGTRCQAGIILIPESQTVISEVPTCIGGVCAFEDPTPPGIPCLSP